MGEDQIILQALDNLKTTTAITGKWYKSSASKADGLLIITANGTA